MTGQLWFLALTSQHMEFITQNTGKFIAFAIHPYSVLESLGFYHLDKVHQLITKAQ